MGLCHVYNTVSGCFITSNDTELNEWRCKRFYKSFVAYTQPVWFQPVKNCRRWQVEYNRSKL